MLLHANKCLTELDLSANRLGGEASMVIAEALKYNVGLKRLNLSDNPLGEDGMRHMMAMIQVSAHVGRARLRFSDCF